ncbi:MAG TPA: carbamoyltransferase N-terminal domain-containing protein [Trebonia sp.]|jgi:carbamoyltransferase|nr:carbamoyltransferase N-terminal domain-containing protein [Trebonia sp.]
MLICGMKLSHDGAVALLHDNRLVFSVEVEKLHNNHRYAKVPDLGLVFQLVRDYGYDPADVDHFVIDGWRRTERLEAWGGQQVRVETAPYRRGMAHAELFHAYKLRMLDLDYLSYHHYAGHVASALCTSPALARGEDSYVVCWDGGMFPYLYHYSVTDNRLRDLGPLFSMIGNTYQTLANRYPPFDVELPFQAFMALPGKIMSYVAKGRPSDAGRKMFADAYEQARTAVFGTGPVPDERNIDINGRNLLAEMTKRVTDVGADPEDMLATMQDFMGDMLLRTLTAAVDADGRRTPNLCLVGGCALNIKWNRAIRESGIAAEVWVPPFPNDAGSALGTACCALLDSSADKALAWDVYSGPTLLPSEAAEGWMSRSCTPAELAQILHTRGDPVVFLSGRAELGPRALGHRSILAPAVDPAMKARLNEVKQREPYRPVAPICLEHRASEVFDPGTADPFMLFDQDVRSRWRDRVPAICHLDGTSRIQTVNRRQEPVVHELLTAYEHLSGIPLLCNTSANFNGSGFFPDVRSAMDWGKIPCVWSEGRLYEPVTPSS